MNAVTVKLKAEPMELSEIAAAVKAIRKVLPLMEHGGALVTIAATANAVMQTAANIRLTATLKGLNQTNG